MPVYRGPDGKIVVEKSKKTDDGTVPTDRIEEPAPPAHPGGRETAGGSNEHTKPGRQPAPERGGDVAGGGRLDEPTKLLGQTEPATDFPVGRRKKKRASTPGPGKEEERTVINVGAGPRPGDRREPAVEPDGMNDPVVGWLAIVEGPGKGKALQLGNGSNPIGRGRTARVSLDFGDNQISRGGHAVVTYDPRGRKFFVQHGGGKNLTYLGDQPVLVPTELPAHSHIHIGSTVLRFVPLCGDAFDWQDAEQGAKD